MFNISTFLEKFKKLDTEKSLLRGTVAQILFQYGDISLDAKQLKIKDGVVMIVGASSALKNQVFFKKQILLAAFQEKLGKGHIIDIR